MQRQVQSFFRSQISANVMACAFKKPLRRRHIRATSFSSKPSTFPSETLSPEIEKAITNAVKNCSGATPFSQSWFDENAVSIIAVAVSVISMGWSYMNWCDQKALTIEWNSVREQEEEKSKKKHEDHYIKQVENYLSANYKMTHDRFGDIPGLTYVAHDVNRVKDLTNIMSSPGGLTLLEGPSGCGKTTAVQHCLQELNNAGVYFSVRDNVSGLNPFAAFAQAFGIADLSIEMSSKALDILRKSLKQRRCNNKKPPVLVIDDVQQLFKSPAKDEGGIKILEWCLGRAANGELTVLFISCETVQHLMKQLSGYAARLSTPDTPLEYISPNTLRPALESIHNKGSFTSSEIDSVLRVIGTHMSDVRGIQRLRTERNLSVQQALDELVKEEARTLKRVLVELSVQKSTTVGKKLTEEEQKLFPLIAIYICEMIAEDNTGQPVALNTLMDAMGELSINLSDSFCKALMGTVSKVVDDLVAQNVLRRSFLKHMIDDGLVFHRPVKRSAFQELRKTRAFRRIKQEFEEKVFATIKGANG